MTKTFDLSPEQAYELVLAALDVVGSVSLGVHDRIKRDVDKLRRPASRPSVDPWTLLALRKVLNKLNENGGMAERVIAENDRLRQERRTNAS